MRVCERGGVENVGVWDVGDVGVGVNDVDENVDENVNAKCQKCQM